MGEGGGEAVWPLLSLFPHAFFAHRAHAPAHLRVSTSPRVPPPPKGWASIPIVLGGPCGWGRVGEMLSGRPSPYFRMPVSCSDRVCGGGTYTRTRCLFLIHPKGWVSIPIVLGGPCGWGKDI